MNLKNIFNRKKVIAETSEQVQKQNVELSEVTEVENKPVQISEMEHEIKLSDEDYVSIQELKEYEKEKLQQNILQLLQEHYSYTKIQAKLNVLPRQISEVVHKYNLRNTTTPATTPTTTPLLHQPLQTTTPTTTLEKKKYDKERVKMEVKKWKLEQETEIEKEKIKAEIREKELQFEREKYQHEKEKEEQEKEIERIKNILPPKRKPIAGEYIYFEKKDIEVKISSIMKDMAFLDSQFLVEHAGEGYKMFIEFENLQEAKLEGSFVWAYLK